MEDDVRRSATNDTNTDDSDDALDDMLDERLMNIRTAERVAVWSVRLGRMFIVILGLSVIATILDVLERGADVFNVLLSDVIASVGTGVLFSLGGYVFFTGLGAGLQVLADIAANSRLVAKHHSKETGRNVSNE